MPHGDRVTAGKMTEVRHAHTPVTLSLLFLLSVCSQNLQSVTNVSLLISYCRPTVVYFAEEKITKENRANTGTASREQKRIAVATLHQIQRHKIVIGGEGDSDDGNNNNER